jgi:hypothetical protein
MATKKKAVKKKEKHSQNLKLSGPVPEFVKKIKINKNVPVPMGWATAGKWDHLLVKLEYGDSVELTIKEAASFVNRARNLGYLVVTRKVSDTRSRVWFEGLHPIQKKKAKRKR